MRRGSWLNIGRTLTYHFLIGVHGRLADLCQPTESRFKTAVGTVLGRNNDAIVVDMEETGISCIEVSIEICRPGIYN